MAPVRFGSVMVWGWNGSSGSGSRFRRFLCKKGFSVFQYSFTGKDGSGFGSWKTVPAVPVPLSVSGKTVPTVPVSSSGSVPEPPCLHCHEESLYHLSAVRRPSSLTPVRLAQKSYVCASAFGPSGTRLKLGV